MIKRSWVQLPNGPMQKKTVRVAAVEPINQDLVSDYQKPKGYSSAVQPAAHGPHAAREGISCGPPLSHKNCSFGPVISQMFDGLLRFQISENGRICGFH